MAEAAIVTGDALPAIVAADFAGVGQITRKAVAEAVEQARREERIALARLYVQVHERGFPEPDTPVWGVNLRFSEAILCDSFLDRPQLANCIAEMILERWDRRGNPGGQKGGAPDA